MPLLAPTVRVLRSPDRLGHRAGPHALALGLLACLLVALLLAGLVWHSYGRAEAEGLARLSDLASRQQIRNDDQLEAAEGLTASLASALAPILTGRLAPAGGTGTADGRPEWDSRLQWDNGRVAHSWTHIRSALAGRPNLAGVALVTADGLQFVGVAGAVMPPRFIGNDAWFRDLEEVPPTGIGILPPRYEPLHGGWALPVGRRILRADGATLGYIVAELRLPVLVSALAESDLRRTVSARLLRDDGLVLAAYPADPAALGAPLDGFPDRRQRILAAQSAGPGGYAAAPGEAPAAYEMSGRFHTILAVTAPADWIAADWLRRMWPFILAALAILLVAVAVSIGAARQIGQRAAAMARMRIQNVLLAAQQDGALQGVAVADESGRLQYFNRQAEAIWRLQGQLAAGQRIEFLQNRIAGMLADPAELREMAGEAARPAAGSLRAVLHLRDARRVECTVKALVDARGDVIGRIWSFLDISSELRAEEAIRWRSDYDPLTHLPNRFRFQAPPERGDAGRAAARRSRRAAVYRPGRLQVDQRHPRPCRGRPASGSGRRPAQHLRAQPRQPGPAGRRRIHRDAAAHLRRGRRPPCNMARRILAAVAEPYAVDGHVCHLSASIGIVMFPSETDDVTALLKKADMSMYAAKAEGKNRYCFFTPEMDAAVAERQRIELDMRAALGTGQFLFHYQPIIDLERGTLAGFEALLRWQHPTEGVLAPGRFVEVAEETGLINRISADAILQATADLAPLFAAKPRLHLAVNLSVRQFQDESLVDLLAALRQAGRIPLERFVFEITESLMMTGDDNTRKMFDLVRGSGAKIAVDDFGTGYSSLVYLQNFPVDYLKVDRSFVSNMIENDDSRQLVNSILSMAKSLRMEAIAEGVEDEAQVRHLQAHHCELAQGYYFSRPLSLPEALAFADNPDLSEAELPLPEPAVAAQ